MVPNLSVISSNSTGSSTRATQLYRPGESKPHRSSSWSARDTDPPIKQFNSISPSRRSGNKLAEDNTHLAPPDQGSPGSNGGNRIRAATWRGQRKSVTFEDDIQEPNGRDTVSPAGTVRRILPSRGLVKPVFFPDGLEDGYGENGQEPIGEEELLKPPAIVTGNSPYEHWRRLRRRLERKSESTNFPAPDDDWLLRPKERTRSRTVSHEDVLTGRGANPRTGVVSPSIVSASSQAEDSRGSLGQLPGNHKWRLKGDQWISLETREETPTSTPPDMETPPRLADGRSYRRPKRLPNGHGPQQSNVAVPLSELEDRFVVNMPSAREPCPPTLTPEQIEEFQRNISRAHDPKHNSPPALAGEPRSEEPKMPNQRNFSIRRKAVGSSPSVSRRKHPDGHNHPNNAMRTPAQAVPKMSSAPPPRQRQYYNADEVGRDLVGSTFNKQVSNARERNENVSKHPFLDLSKGQGPGLKSIDGDPLFPNMKSPPPLSLTLDTRTKSIMTGGQETGRAGTQKSTQDLQRMLQASPNWKQCRCPNPTIPSKIPSGSRWLQYCLPNQRKGSRRPTGVEKENQGAVASTNTSTLTTTSIPITTSSTQGQVTVEKQMVNLTCSPRVDDTVCPRHATVDQAESQPQNEINPRRKVWNKDAVSCNVAPQKNVPSHLHDVADPAQQIHSQALSNMPGYTHMQEIPNGDGKMSRPSGERCGRCQGYYYVRDAKHKAFSGLKKSYTLVEQSCVRPVEKRVPSRNGKLYRRNTDGAVMASIEAGRPCCGFNAVPAGTNREDISTGANPTDPSPKEDDDSLNELGFLDPLFLLLSESHTLLQRHRAFQHTKNVVNRLLSMSAHCIDVVVRVYDSCCVYSQTGSWPQSQDQELNRLMRDLGRAGIYLVVLATVATLLGRAWTYVVMVGSWFLWVIMPVRWAVGRVFGMMFSSD